MSSLLDYMPAPASPSCSSYIHISTHIHTQIYISRCIYIYINMYTYIYICIYIQSNIGSAWHTATLQRHTTPRHPLSSERFEDFCLKAKIIKCPSLSHTWEFRIQGAGSLRGHFPLLARPRLLILLRKGSGVRGLGRVQGLKRGVWERSGSTFSLALPFGFVFCVEGLEFGV